MIDKKIIKMIEDISGSTQEFKHINLLSGRIKWDYMLRNENIRSGVTLCKECDGTGNILFIDFKKCPFCDGTGEANED